MSNPALFTFGGVMYALNLLEIVEGSCGRIFRGRFYNINNYNDVFHWAMLMDHDMPFEEFLKTLRGWANHLEKFEKERRNNVKTREDR
jgi:hypothetical protein